jgi:hypothetical protein
MAIDAGTGVAGLYLVLTTDIPEDHSVGDLDTARLESWEPLTPAPWTVNFLNIQGPWQARSADRGRGLGIALLRFSDGGEPARGSTLPDGGGWGT